MPILYFRCAWSYIKLLRANVLLIFITLAILYFSQVEHLVITNIRFSKKATLLSTSKQLLSHKFNSFDQLHVETRVVYF